MATRIEGSDSSGFEKTLYGGSRGYMAPEILKKVPYSGQVIDLFAFGVLLFTMYVGVPPFE
jgi:serine/threonine protein kinase